MRRLTHKGGISDLLHKGMFRWFKGSLSVMIILYSSEIWVDPHSEGYQEHTTQVDVLVTYCEGIMGSSPHSQVLISPKKRSIDDSSQM